MDSRVPQALPASAGHRLVGASARGLPLRPLASPRAALTGGALAGALLTPLCLAFVTPQGFTTPPLVLALLAAVLVPLAWAAPDVRRASQVLAVALVVGVGAAMWALASDALPTRPYGDGAILAAFIADGRAMPRWLAGSAMAAVAHAVVWEAPPVRAVLPSALATPAAFLSIACALSMLLGTLALWRRWPGRLAVLLPALTPVWVLFASGYVEYYPLVAPAFVAALAWTFEVPLEERSPWAIGGLCGALPVLYIGFSPVALLIGGIWWRARRRDALPALTIAGATAWLVVVACWPEGVVSFVRTLYGVLNLGDAHLHPRYFGHVAGPASPMFTAGFATSPTHLRDVAYLLAWGGGWWTMPLLAATALVSMGSAGARLKDHARDARVWLGVLLVAWQTYYLLFMVPRLGVTEDVDLFFSTYLVIAFMAGRLLDATVTTRDRRVAPAVLGLACASLAFTGPLLVWWGLPPGP